MEEQPICNATAGGVWSFELVGLPHSSGSGVGLSAQQAEEQSERYRGALHSDGNFSFREASVAEVELINDFYYVKARTGVEPPYVVAFVNSRSGNTTVSRAIRKQLETLLARSYKDSTGRKAKFRGEIVELADGPPRDRIRDVARSQAGRRIRFLVCGGDGTVTWILQEIEACKESNPDLFRGSDLDPPIGIVPAGTGNDLARSLGWGPSLSRVSDLVGYVRWALEGCPVTLDQWKLTLRGVSSPELLPPAFRPVDGQPRTFEGFFQNYFTIGMDAAVTFGVERARGCCLGRLCFRLGLGKLCYGLQGYRTGVFKCCCRRRLSIRNNAVRLAGGREVALGGPRQRGIRQFMLLNINSYAAGRTVYSDADLGTVDPSDRRLELLAIGHTCKFGLLMGECATAPILQQLGDLKMTLERGEFFQMDGEAWYIPEGCGVEVIHNRQVRMLRPPTCPTGVWAGRQVAGFWGPAAQV